MYYDINKLSEVLKNHADYLLTGDASKRADLSDAYLRGAYLSGADLRGADLSDANLRGADLSDADLRGAYLHGADTRDADLRGAYLTGARLPINIDLAEDSNG